MAAIRRPAIPHGQQSGAKAAQDVIHDLGMWCGENRLMPHPVTSEPAGHPRTTATPEVS